MKIYNSLKREKEEFVPIGKDKIGMYVCGPTVYDAPHIGHARSAYIFDVVRRYFAYKDYKVTFVRNVTDVDDKIIEKARTTNHQPPTTNLKDLTKEVSKKYLDAYHDDMALLGIDKPDKEPKATEYIPKMIKFIELLIKKDRAYASEGDVYFDIRSAKRYGKLSNQSLDKMEVGARIAPGEKKRDPLDFALWKKTKDDEPSWESPWGRGRPGWHIECSVMSSDILGDKFDIHGGGIDLIFPHHENEIAQSEGAGKGFAGYWMHNGLLTINGEKMAKSLGNFITIKDFLAKHNDPDYLKLLFLGTHYRHPVDYSEEKIREAKSQKERFLILIEKIDRFKSVKVSKCQSVKDERSPELQKFRSEFEKAMDDDFNTPLALAAMFDLVTHANRLMQDKDGFSAPEIKELSAIRAELLELGRVLGLDLSKSAAGQELDERSVLAMIARREKARSDKDFKEADRIRKELSGKGVILEDAKDGTTWRRKA